MICSGSSPPFRTCCPPPGQNGMTSESSTAPSPIGSVTKTSRQSQSKETNFLQGKCVPWCYRGHTSRRVKVGEQVKCEVQGGLASSAYLYHI